MRDHKQKLIIHKKKINSKSKFQTQWVYGGVLSALTVLTCKTVMAAGSGGLPDNGFLDFCKAGVDPTTTARSNFYGMCKGGGPGSATPGVAFQTNTTATAGLQHEETTAQGSTSSQSSQKQISNVRERIESVRKEGDSDESNLLENSRRAFFINGGFRSGEGTKTNSDAADNGFGDGIDPTKDTDTAPSIAQGQRAFDTDGQEITIGTDYRLDDEKTVVGVALGYDQREAKFTDQSDKAKDDAGNVINGGVDSEGFHVSGYVTRAVSDNAYIDGVVSIT